VAGSTHCTQFPQELHPAKSQASGCREEGAVSTADFYTNPTQERGCKCFLFPYLSRQFRWMRNPKESLDKTGNEKVSVSGSSAPRLAASRVSSGKTAFNYRAALLLNNIFISPAALPGRMGQWVLAAEHPVPCHCVTPAIFPRLQPGCYRDTELRPPSPQKKSTFGLVGVLQGCFFPECR